MKFDFSAFLLLAGMCLLASCGGDDDLSPEDQLAQDLEDIDAYLLDNGLTAQSTASGLHYIIEEEGTGTNPQVGEDITVFFTGFYLDDQEFDGTDLYPVTFPLAAAIDGWQEGIPLFERGGGGKLFLPSALGFGNNPPDGVRKNAVLAFDLELIDDLSAYEQERIQTYLDDNNLMAQTTASGVKYIVEQEGDGDFPTTNATVVVRYKGYFLDGTVFDESAGSSVSFPLANVIKGWQEGIPKFSRGGSGKLVIPSKEAYGQTPPAGIPQNAILVFDIELVNF